MAIEYTWKVTGVKTRTEDMEPDFVYQTYWTKTGTDGEYSGTFTGATPLKADPTQPFTPFNELTEAQVLGWIQAEVNAQPSYVQHINDQIQKAIDAAKNPSQEPPLPWAPPEPPTPPAEVTP